MTRTPDDVASELALSPEEDAILASFQFVMMQADIEAEKSEKRRAIKRDSRKEFRDRVVEALTSGETPDDVAPWLVQVRTDMEGAVTKGRTALLESIGPDHASEVGSRSRSLLLLIDLCGFEPWGGQPWVASARKGSVAAAHAALPHLRPNDVEMVERAYREAVRAVRNAARPWGRIALVGVVGVGLGAVTAGLAAPVLGGLFGSVVLGYSGAVATSAGLAALGGGSIAAGGFGMVGGTALIAGLGGIAGVGTAVGGARASGWTAAAMVADAIRLEVVTRLVLLDTEGDDEAARKVVEGLHLRIGELHAKAGLLVQQITDARAELAEVKSEMTRLRRRSEADKARMQALEEQLEQLTDTQKGISVSQSALEKVSDRLEAA